MNNEKQTTTEKKVAKYLDTMAKHLFKLTTRISKNMGDNNQSIDFLLDYLDTEPLVLALSKIYVY